MYLLEPSVHVTLDVLISHPSRAPNRARAPSARRSPELTASQVADGVASADLVLVSGCAVVNEPLGP